MNILLTGGTGFIGSYIAKQLSDEGHCVTIMARNANKIPRLKLLPGVVVENVSLHDYEQIKKLVVGKDALIHVALDYNEGAVNMLQSDTLASVNLFETAAKAGVKQIIYTSSTASVDFVYMTNYGRNMFATKPIDEDYTPIPTSFYGATKAASEMYLKAIGYTYNVKVNIIRPGYIFGNPVIDGAPTQPDSRFKDLVRKIKNNETVNIAKNDGTQFLWAGSIAKVYAALLNADMNQEVFFVLGSKFYSWEKICKTLIAAKQSKSILEVENADSPDASEDSTSFGVAKLKEKLGFDFDNEWKHILEHIEYFYQTV